MRFVLDASVAVEFLLRTPLGQSVVPLLTAAELVAPELLDVEVLAVLRREVRRGALEAGRAEEAVADLAAWPIRRVSHRDLLREAWTLRHNVSAWDAIYLATARAFQASVLTADGPLSRVTPVGIAIQNVRV